MKRQRWLAVCERGNCRSVHLAYILKDDLKQDAIACGVKAADSETLEMLGKWADTIVLCDKALERWVPESWLDKMVVFDVGEDRYFRGFNKELIELFYGYLREHNKKKENPENH